ncbi:MAG TPA: hypothetical protein VFT55_17900 [Planctomycetota bacterium]|nr:hypothetical protein [Planctomycetota bacterium]
MTEIADTKGQHRGTAAPPRTERQAHAAFYLAGRHGDAGPRAVVGGLCPALMARHRQLAELRYDYPLILVDDRDAETSVVSLSGWFDRILAAVATGDDADQIRHHGLRLEREIRALTAPGTSAMLSQLWSTAAQSMCAADDAALADSLARLGSRREIDGLVVACDGDTPRRFFEHVFCRVQGRRVARLRARIERLTHGLEQILQAEAASSPAGLQPDRLRSSVGSAFAAEFDFDALARLLTNGRPNFSLSPARRERVRGLLAVLASQRFCSRHDVHGRPEGATAHEFVFESCSAAIAAYRERFGSMLELAKALVMAELEVDGRYREDTHGALFAAWSEADVDPEALELFPEYLVCVDAEQMSATDSVECLETLASDLPIKVLVQANDLFEPTVHGGPALSARLHASSALGSGRAFVMQSTSSDLYRARDRVRRGLAVPGPALFVVYSGAHGPANSGLPAYLASAAALESRAFPAFCYDPSAGATWAERFSLQGNPQPERDWPVHQLCYEDDAVQRVTVDVAFTIADLLASDARYAAHVALAPGATVGNTAPVAELVAAPGVLPEKIPFVLAVDAQDTLHRVLVDGRLIRLARRGLQQWRSLQELGGIHNSHAERQLAIRQKAWDEERARLQAQPLAGSLAPAPAAAAAAPFAATPAAQQPAAADPDVAWIETPRCSTCNECTRINDRMFKYNENKQAYIADPDAGTFAQLVQAAESCQVAIIHPGKPRNPAEPGLAGLLERAAKFA